MNCRSSVDMSNVVLDEGDFITQCRKWGQETAVSQHWETNDGGCLNDHHRLYCLHCGHNEGEGCDNDVDYNEAYSRYLESLEASFYDTPFGDALSTAVDARCELALARSLASTNEAASAEHLEAAYSIARNEGRYAYCNDRKISPLMATEPFLLRYWEEGVSDAKCDEAIYRAGLG